MSDMCDCLSRIPTTLTSEDMFSELIVCQENNEQNNIGNPCGLETEPILSQALLIISTLKRDNGC